MKDERKRRFKCNYSSTIHVERINIKEKEIKGNFNYKYTWLPILQKKKKKHNSETAGTNT